MKMLLYGGFSDAFTFGSHRYLYRSLLLSTIVLNDRRLDRLDTLWYRKIQETKGDIRKQGNIEGKEIFTR